MTAPLTARFESVPASHDGSNAFTLGLALSEEFTLSYRTLRDEAFDVTGGAVRKARRRVQGSNRTWTITVQPNSRGAVTVVLPETSDCNAAGAICTDDDRPLSRALSATVAGPVGMSAADARVHEAAGATVDFEITLSLAALETVTVDYATSDRTATAGTDYTSTSGTLTFAAGETSKTVQVPVLEDSIDEGEETFTLTLSNVSGGNAWLSDATATGTIENSDPMPRAWLAGFGRAVASQAVGAIGGRMEGGGGAHVKVGGQSLTLSGGPVESGGGESVGSVLDALSPTGGSDSTTRSMTGREVLLGSSFQLSAGSGTGAPALTTWGQIATGGSRPTWTARAWTGAWRTGSSAWTSAPGAGSPVSRSA